ncbi:MAG: alpha-2-macroglobulin [Bacteroidota bacterium]|nr:alpha-2-macroglobulin [Bacteroidota bacterium]
MLTGKFLFTRFLSLFVFIAISGVVQCQTTGNYQKQWNTADSLIKKGLTRSALDKVQGIYLQAKKTGAQPELIRALIYQTALRSNIEEDATKTSIDSLEREISRAKEPARSILESYTAEVYRLYYQLNRYRIYDRTPTIGIEKKDIATWDARELNDRISALYSSSLKDAPLLKEISIESYSAALEKGNSATLRPTLFDFLAFRALDYFGDGEAGFSQPGSPFTITDPRALEPASDFVHLTLPHPDTGSLHYKAFRLYQALLLFHLRDKNPDALIDADLRRLSFVYSYSEFPGKESCYLEALRQLSRRYAGNPASAEASFLAVQLWYNQATESSPKALVEVKSMLDSIIARFPDSRGGIQAYNLREQILHPTLRLTTEKVNVPGLAFRTLVNYKNLDTVYFRIIPVRKKLDEYLQDNGDNDSVFARLARQKAIRSWAQYLPGLRDYRNHSVEVKVDPLPVGQYILLGSEHRNFLLSDNGLAAAQFFVSDISFVRSDRQFFVLNRTTGRPLSNATIKIFEQRNSDRAWKNPLKYLQSLTSDSTGFFQLPKAKKEKYQSVRLDITFGSDRLFLNDFLYNYYYDPREDDLDEQDQEDYDDDHAQVFVFTDRAIYRPGQRVYFKGIGVTRNWKSGRPELLHTRDSLQVFLVDANSQNVDSMKVTLNDFSSLNGSFLIPEGRLTGDYQILIPDYSNSSASFSVEEYKRPTFYTEFEKVKGSYRLNDTIYVRGLAMGYAGNPIDGAKVSYTVTRRTQFPYPWLFGNRRIPYPSSAEIAHGTLVTGPDGHFVIAFKALADSAENPRMEPVFQYQVEADVTDQSGETRSGNTQVAAGYKSLNLQIDLADQSSIDIDSLHHIEITARNLSEEPVDLPATVKIYELKSPQRLIRNRYWGAPDQHLYTRAEYLKYFPHDEYDSELDIHTWPLGALVYQHTDSTGTAEAFKLEGTHLHSGWYEVEATAMDSYGQPVKDLRYIQVFDPKDSLPPFITYEWQQESSRSYSPGDTLRIRTGSSADSVYLIREINRQTLAGDTHNEFSHASLDHHLNLYQKVITAGDHGGFSWNGFFVRDNRLYFVRRMVQVPWSDKTLKITFDTYRDKTLPGSKESWKLSIRGSHREKVAAEMLASMYDASLDQFKPQAWSMPALWPNLFGTDYWSGGQNFQQVNSFVRMPETPLRDLPERIYPSFITPPDFDHPLRIRGVATGSISEMEIRKGLPMARQALVSSTRRQLSDVVVTVGYGISSPKAPPIQADTLKLGIPQTPDQGIPQNPIRKDFRETAFFFPDLRTDSSGNISLDFTLPESVTRWNLLTLAHTQNVQFGLAGRSLITQKKLMVEPNAPRFLREGDTLYFPAKISNLSDHDMTGTVTLKLLRTSSMKDVDQWFDNTHPTLQFSVAANRSTEVSFPLIVPQNFNDALTYQIVARTTGEPAGEEGFSDGEEAFLPVLPNRILVTESLPLEVQGTGTHTFTFDKLLQSGSSKTLSSYGLTVEYTANPVWYAVQSLPYLMEDPYECAEQIFNRYYSNALASTIVQEYPKIGGEIKKWGEADSTALKSPLQTHADLKSILLQETPWLLDAQTEQAQRRNLALLLQPTRIQQGLAKALRELQDRQAKGGGFPWFKGDSPDRFITQYILTGIGHLQKLQAIPAEDSAEWGPIISKALHYCDQKMEQDYGEISRVKEDNNRNHLSPEVIQYLYMRSFFPGYPVARSAENGFLYYRSQAVTYWLSQGPYFKAMIALVLYRSGQPAVAKEILKVLKENAVVNPKTGMYFKECAQGGYWWYQSPIESQALMIEAFSEIARDPGTIGQLKIWLLKNKQTHHWATTKATADACYALLQDATGTYSPNTVTVDLGSLRIPEPGVKTDSSAGYFMKKIPGSEVLPSMGHIRVTLQIPDYSVEVTRQEDPSWGAVYWQYFENLDKITHSETPLKLSKALFIEKNTDRGPVLFPIKDGDSVHIGDKIRVRMVLQVDRDMEYVHMKDLRAAGLQTVQVLSGYHYQDGLGYYESTRDASTDFFFSRLRRGTYVFEYPLFAAQAGDFSNGIANIECMYAPEFTSHSSGIRLSILPGTSESGPRKQ